MSTLLATFLTAYYTDTAGIAAAAATMFLVCRLLDGVTDFAMGGIADKTNTKLGKARPWLVLAAPMMFGTLITRLQLTFGWTVTGIILGVIAGAILMILGFSIVGLAGNSLPMVIAGTVVRSLGITPMFAGLYAFVADAADYGEWKFGIRSEGLMSASQSIGSKIGIGFGSACSAWILAISGYIQQPESVIAAIRFDYGWLGAIVSIILLICVLMMDVEKYLPEIRKGLGKAK